MWRVTRVCWRALPFEPMALSTLETLQSRLQHIGNNNKDSNNDNISASDGDDGVSWFARDAPFFVSPKHDGVRLVSYTSSPPPSSSACTHDRQQQQPHDDTQQTTPSTCFTRYGRPVYGLFWLERELRLLRDLCGDAALVLDGELYIHRSHTNNDCHTRSKTRSKPAHAGGATATAVTCTDTFHTGFLAVNALVHRLRGSSLRNASPATVRQHVSTLPDYCVFDVASYSPPVRREQAALHTTTTTSSSSACVARELRRVWCATARDYDVHAAEQLRVVPNVTPFSARLRTMYFLFALLQRGCASPLLRRCYLHEHGEEAQQSRQQHDDKRDDGAAALTSPRRTRAAARSASLSSSRVGGTHVHMVSYRLVSSLDEATRSVLPHYVQRGYEGAVARAPTNVYAMREKQKHTVAQLVAPLLLPSSSQSVQVHAQQQQQQSCRTRSRRCCAAAAAAMTAVASSQCMLRLVPHRGNSSGTRMQTHYGNNNSNNSNNVSDDALVAVDSAALAQRAMTRARQLPRRSATAVKLLPYCDREFAVLRPLLKPPSRNPRTRQLVHMTRAEVYAAAQQQQQRQRQQHKNKVAIAHNANNNASGSAAYDVTARALIRRTALSTAALRRAATPHDDDKAHDSARAADEATSPVVVFYGLQCLTDTGRVFNVSLPKMSLEQQRVLLHHLLGIRRRDDDGDADAHGEERGKTMTRAQLTATRPQRQQKARSLTGLYATIKYSTLTEHGVPRFATVKAIRGGKGWFM